MPALAFGLGLLVLVTRPNALPAALPILLLWGCSKIISAWLNRPPASRSQVSRSEASFLRNSAVHMWRYFAEFSTEEHNWLIPDNIQEQPPAVAARVSPTNLGFLLNARQVACEFGYLTVPEFTEQTLRTLATVTSLRKHRVHLLNWYGTRTPPVVTGLRKRQSHEFKPLKKLHATMHHGSCQNLQLCGMIVSLILN